MYPFEYSTGYGPRVLHSAEVGVGRSEGAAGGDSGGGGGLSGGDLLAFGAGVQGHEGHVALLREEVAVEVVVRAEGGSRHGVGVVEVGVAVGVTVAAAERLMQAGIVGQLDWLKET